MSDFLVIFIKYFFPAIMVGIILYDFFSMTIPNGLNILLFFGFCGLALMVGMSFENIGWHMLAAFITLMVGFAGFAIGIFGGGDAKAIAAVAIWFGMSLDTLMFLLIMALFGGLFAFILIGIRKLNLAQKLPEKFSQIQWVKTLITPELNLRMPYGVAIGASGLYMYSPDKWL